ncbi:hypothetical protein Poli38472_000196 [Pythium oligandrum]|uniref:FYVE-type domain-containing protein n=1 Tax=Pythium oligandrum TaxID=41045 RepID=A0A8K1CBT7_PYTOL|nr:hypothetical protein Poli38472_000196 [Pythium oligandrum]|eukprot:TMW60154.1 hypothetical protein Poli38472_000196 [Pythium oligandrum]
MGLERFPVDEGALPRVTISTKRLDEWKEVARDEIMRALTNRHSWYNAFTEKVRDGYEMMADRPNMKAFLRGVPNSADKNVLIRSTLENTTLDDIVYGTYCETTFDVRCQFAHMYEENFLDGGLLHTHETRTPEDPLHFVGIKWIAFRSPAPAIVTSRDFVFFTYDGSAVDAKGQRVLFRFLRTMPMDDVPVDSSKLPPLVRGKISNIHFYRESGNNVEAFTKAMYSNAGNMPSWVVTKTISFIYPGVENIATVGDARALMINGHTHLNGARLSGQKNSFGSSSSSVKSSRPTPSIAASNTCGVCYQKFSLTRSKRPCQGCNQTVCKRCTIQLCLFDEQKQISPTSVARVRFCMNCVRSARNEANMSKLNLPSTTSLTSLNSSKSSESRFGHSQFSESMRRVPSQSSFVSQSRSQGQNPEFDSFIREIHDEEYANPSAAPSPLPVQRAPSPMRPPSQPQYHQPQYVQSPANYQQQQPQYLQSPANYQQQQPQYLQSPANYQQQQPQYLQSPANYQQPHQPQYLQSPANYQQQQPQYAQSPAHYQQQPPQFQQPPAPYLQPPPQRPVGPPMPQAQYQRPVGLPPQQAPQFEEDIDGRDTFSEFHDFGRETYSEFHDDRETFSEFHDRDTMDQFHDRDTMDQFHDRDTMDQFHDHGDEEYDITDVENFRDSHYDRNSELVVHAYGSQAGAKPTTQFSEKYRQSEEFSISGSYEEQSGPLGAAVDNVIEEGDEEEEEDEHKGRGSFIPLTLNEAPSTVLSMSKRVSDVPQQSQAYQPQYQPQEPQYQPQQPQYQPHYQPQQQYASPPPPPPMQPGRKFSMPMALDDLNGSQPMSMNRSSNSPYQGQQKQMHSSYGSSPFQGQQNQMQSSYGSSPFQGQQSQVSPYQGQQKQLSSSYDGSQYQGPPQQDMTDSVRTATRHQSTPNLLASYRSHKRTNRLAGPGTAPLQGFLKRAASDDTGTNTGNTYINEDLSASMRTGLNLNDSSRANPLANSYSGRAMDKPVATYNAPASMRGGRY